MCSIKPVVFKIVFSIVLWNNSLNAAVPTCKNLFGTSPIHALLAKTLTEIRESGYEYATSKDDLSWPEDGPQFGIYEQAFGPLLRKFRLSGIKESIARRKANGLDTHALDLFGSGFFFMSAGNGVKSITGIRLSRFPRTRLPKNYRNLSLPKEITGDVLNPRTWLHLDDWMSTQGIQKMDIVTMHPAGGGSHTPLSSSAKFGSLVVRSIIANVSLRLSKNGVFYFDLAPPHGANPDFFLTSEFQDFAKQIELHSNHKLLFMSDSYKGLLIRIYGALVPKAPY